MWLKMDHVSSESLDCALFHKFISTHMDGDELQELSCKT